LIEFVTPYDKFALFIGAPTQQEGQESGQEEPTQKFVSSCSDHNSAFF